MTTIMDLQAARTRPGWRGKWPVLAPAFLMGLVSRREDDVALEVAQGMAGGRRVVSPVEVVAESAVRQPASGWSAVTWQR